MNEIIAQKKYGEFHVHLDGRLGCWAQGKTLPHAVGTLVCDHPELFSVKMNFDNVDSLAPSKD